MDQQKFIKTASVCFRSKEMAHAKACFLVALDREATGMGDGAALVWDSESGKRRLLFAQGTGRGAIPKSSEIDALDEVLYDDEPEVEPLDDEQPENGLAADYRVRCMRFGADVDLFFHVNRTNDGITVKEDAASMGDDLGRDSREIPIVYWNAGSTPVKADGCPLRPGQYHIVFPNDPQRTARRKLREEKDKCLAEFIVHYNDDKILMVQKQILELEPRCTEAQAYDLAKQFLAQHPEI